MSRVSKLLKKLSLIYKQTISNKLVEYMKPKLQAFVKHNFVAPWQDKHFKICIKSFPVVNMVLIVDFAENYSFEAQNEVQSMHWHTFHINILVHITLRHNLHANPYDENSCILIEYHFHIFNDQKHDSKFVQHCFKLHWNHIVGFGIVLE